MSISSRFSNQKVFVVPSNTPCLQNDAANCDLFICESESTGDLGINALKFSPKMSIAMLRGSFYFYLKSFQFGKSDYETSRA